MQPAASVVPVTETTDADTTEDLIMISDNSTVTDGGEPAAGPIEKDEVLVNPTILEINDVTENEYNAEIEGN